MSKLGVLAFIEEQGEAISADVADYFGWTVPGAAFTLLRLHRRGHLQLGRLWRQREEDLRRWEFAGFAYRLSRKGTGYIEWAGTCARHKPA